MVNFGMLEQMLEHYDTGTHTRQVNGQSRHERQGTWM